MTDNKSTETSKRYGVYNLTLGRFVGAVTSSRPTADEVKSLVPEGHKTEVRELQ